jgi:hypothetical protein
MQLKNGGWENMENQTPAVPAKEYVFCVLILSPRTEPEMLKTQPKMFFLWEEAK